MLRQIYKLTAVQLCNICGVNEVRYTKDRKKRVRFAGMAVLWTFWVLLLVFCLAVLSSVFVKIGLADLVPIYLFMVTSLVILFFSVFKAASVLFQMDTYELFVSLPVSRTAIVVSRFLTMYVTDLLLAFAVMLPGIVIYGINTQPGVSFYLCAAIGTVFLPLLPMTIAAAVGALITAISARMRHKSLVSAALTILFAVVILAGDMSFSGSADEITEEVLLSMVSAMTEQIRAVYAPAAWFGDAAVFGDFAAFLKLLGISALVFVILIAVLQKYYVTICSALQGTTAKNNYRMGRLSRNAPLRALWKRELRRYFASSIYVSNTVIGYILMVLAPAAMLFAGQDQTAEIERMVGVPNLLARGMPFILAFLATLMPTTACSISMEGRQWWIAKSLPISSKMVFDSKILVNLTVAAPFYVAAVILGIFAARPSPLEAIWIAVIPGVYILFTAVAGITVNLALPVLEWENEARAVKQSASTAICMLLGAVSILPPVGFLFLLGGAGNLLMLFVSAVIAVITVVLYRYNNQKLLTEIG